VVQRQIRMRMKIGPFLFLRRRESAIRRLRISFPQMPAVTPGERQNNDPGNKYLQKGFHHLFLNSFTKFQENIKSRFRYSVRK